MHNTTPPEIRDVLAARQVISRHLHRTPLYCYPQLANELGCELYLKHENHQPIGAFKVRGGIFLASRLPTVDPARPRAQGGVPGLISASTGNHGQSIAYAARLFGIRATIAVPENANPAKVDSMRALGAEVIFHGSNFDDAREHVEALSRKEGYRYVHSANEPDLIAGVATYALEILEDQPDIDVILVPVGGGSGAAGCSLVARCLAPHVRVIGVQAESAPAAFRSWKEGRLVEAPTRTAAEGLATRTAFELTQRMLRQNLDDFVLVSDESMRDAVKLLLQTTRNLVELSGAATTAAARQLCSELRGRKVAAVVSGGNISVEQLREVIA